MYMMGDTGRSSAGNSRGDAQINAATKPHGLRHDHRPATAAFSDSMPLPLTGSPSGFAEMPAGSVLTASDRLRLSPPRAPTALTNPPVYAMLQPASAAAAKAPWTTASTSQPTKWRMQRRSQLCPHSGPERLQTPRVAAARCEQRSLNACTCSRPQKGAEVAGIGDGVAHEHERWTRWKWASDLREHGKHALRRDGVAQVDDGVLTNSHHIACRR